MLNEEFLKRLAIKQSIRRLVRELIEQTCEHERYATAERVLVSHGTITPSAPCEPAEDRADDRERLAYC